MLIDMLKKVFLRKGGINMQLSFMKKGESMTIKAIMGKDETRKYIEELGFVPGQAVKVISHNHGNLVVIIKNIHMAIDKSIAMRIIV